MDDRVQTDHRCVLNICYVGHILFIILPVTAQWVVTEPVRLVTCFRIELYYDEIPRSCSKSAPMIWSSTESKWVQKIQTKSSSYLCFFEFSYFVGSALMFYLFLWTIRTEPNNTLVKVQTSAISGTLVNILAYDAVSFPIRTFRNPVFLPTFSGAEFGRTWSKRIGGNNENE